VKGPKKNILNKKSISWRFCDTKIKKNCVPMELKKGTNYSKLLHACGGEGRKKENRRWGVKLLTNNGGGSSDQLLVGSYSRNIREVTLRRKRKG